MWVKLIYFISRDHVSRINNYPQIISSVYFKVKYNNMIDLKISALPFLLFVSLHCVMHSQSLTY